MRTMTTRQRTYLGLLIAFFGVYLGLTFTAPHSTSNSPYHFSLVQTVLLVVTIIGLFLVSTALGFMAWLGLNRYSLKLPEGLDRKAFGRMGDGIGMLVIGLATSSIISSAKLFFVGDPTLTALATQLNFYIIIVFPFLGFFWLRLGSHYLASAAHTDMPWTAKLGTIGPPVALLATFYTFMMFTNSAPDTQIVVAGTTGTALLVVSILAVAASWTFGLLAALNIERATHNPDGLGSTGPFSKLYTGILTTTCGFIILDAIMSLGTVRLQSLPVAALVLLIYMFIGVIGCGFFVVASSTRKLLALPLPKQASKA